MKVLVIGGTRYFGKRLVHLLIERNCQVFILSRNSLPEDLIGKVHKLTADRTCEQELLQVTQHHQFDVVIDQICMNEQDAMGAVSVFKNKTGHYIMTSTLAVYNLGANLKEEEFSPLKDTVHSENVYAENKRKAEKVIAQSRMNASFLRIPIVLGPDDYTERLENTIKGIQNGTPQSLPNLSAKFAFISSSDAARALLWLTETRHSGAFNFSCEAITLGELLKLIEEETRIQALITDQGQHPFRIEDDYYMNVEKVSRLGFTISPYSDWLKPLIQYYVNKKALS